ncbi:MAG TPA: hypothetical protein VM871_05195 [Flavisolibacter sp.]|jgi:hypothetical protein|nr:hypothetical protein [Flavisolibacter sp.]
MKQASLLFVFLFLFATAFSQNCPTLTISCPDETSAGTQVTFTANLERLEGSADY